MQNYDIQCFFQIGTSQFECAFLPLGIGELAMEWRFSEQFPIGFNSSISTQSLKFIKSDRAFLLNEYLRTGEATEIYLIVRIKGNDFRMILDFAAAQWNDEYFECGAKGTPLQDILDNIAHEKKKLTFSMSETLYKVLTNNSLVKIEGKSSTKKYATIEYDNGTRDKTITTYYNINELNCSRIPTYGFMINMPINPPAPIFINTNTDNLSIIPENLTSLFSFRANNSGLPLYRRIKFNFFIDYKLRINTDVVVKLHIDYAKYYNDGTPTSYHELDSQTKMLSYGSNGTWFNYNELLNISYLYGANVGDVYFHIYLTILARPDNVGVDLVTRFCDFSITNFKLETNLSGINRSQVRVVPLKNYLDKLNTFYDIFNTNTLTNEMLKCDLTSINFASHTFSWYEMLNGDNDLDFYVDINDLLQSLSILYGVAVVEKNGKYEFIKLNSLSGIQYRLFDKNTTINYTNSTNYDKLEIGMERGEIKYAADIFGKKVYSQINNRIINTLEITPKLLYSGEKIFELFVKGESNEEVMMLHSLNYYQIIYNQYERPAQFINEYYSNIAVLRRLSPFLSSYFARKGSNLIGDAENVVLTQINHNSYIVQDNGIVSFTTEALGTDHQIFEHYNANFSVPFTTETLLEYITDCKLLKINNNLYLPIKIDVNFEANTIEVECKIFKQ